MRRANVAEIFKRLHRLFLIFRISIRVQKTDRDGFSTSPAEPGLQFRDFVGARRFSDRAVEISALTQPEAHRSRDDRDPSLRREVVQLGAILPADVNYIFKTSRGDQRRTDSFALEQGIRG